MMLGARIKLSLILVGSIQVHCATTELSCMLTRFAGGEGFLLRTSLEDGG